MQRREFLVALPLLIAARSFPGAERTLGIAYGAGTEGSAPRSGLRFGLEEGRRTAQLPGRELTWLEHAGPNALTSLARGGAELVIALGDVGGAFPGGPPVLRVPVNENDRSSCGGEEWHVGPTPEQRAAVLASFRAQRRGAPRELRAVAWAPTLEKYGAQQLNERYLEFARVGMSEGAWLGWIATRVAFECALRGAPAAQLRGDNFAVDGHKGTALRFERFSRRLEQPLYVVDTRSGAPLAEITPEAAQGICTVETAPIR